MWISRRPMRTGRPGISGLRDSFWKRIAYCSGSESKTEHLQPEATQNQQLSADFRVLSIPA